MELVISKKELERRREELSRVMKKEGIDLLYLSSPANVAYITNFFYIPTERPMALILKDDGETILFLPRLEVEHAEKYAYVDKIHSYPEYPDEKHPMIYLSELMRGLGASGKIIGYDVDGYGHVFGYRGPRLSDVFKEAKYVYARDVIESLRMVKSHEEIRLIEESSKWATLGHRLLQEYVWPGLYEDEVSLRASMEATLSMMKALKGYYRAVGWTVGVHVGFRGQVGVHSYYPHSLTIHAIIKRGDVLVSGATALVSGYGAELERTMFVGRPSEEQEKYFNLMVKAQELALENIKAGVKCSDVDKTVRKFYKDHGILEYWRHHTGHGIGLEYHEAPFLDIGDHRTLKAGMVVTVEPGIYVKNLGGFRHSDTVLVVEDGVELITRYPRSLEELTIEV